MVDLVFFIYRPPVFRKSRKLARFPSDFFSVVKMGIFFFLDALLYSDYKCIDKVFTLPEKQESKQSVLELL